MTTRLAYTAYLLGSLLFFVVALQRGSPVVAVGSGLFALGTLLHFRQALRSREASRR